MGRRWWRGRRSLGRWLFLNNRNMLLFVLVMGIFRYLREIRWRWKFLLAMVLMALQGFVGFLLLRGWFLRRRWRRRLGGLSVRLLLRRVGPLWRIIRRISRSGVTSGIRSGSLGWLWRIGAVWSTCWM
jgi:hypothetical protein